MFVEINYHSKLFTSVLVFNLYKRMYFHDFLEFADIAKIKISHKFLILQYLWKPVRRTDRNKMVKPTLNPMQTNKHIQYNVLSSIFNAWAMFANQSIKLKLVSLIVYNASLLFLDLLRTITISWFLKQYKILHLGNGRYLIRIMNSCLEIISQLICFG